jgi:ribosomal protein L7/L12/actin-like ATPase involved in cell morphogenesis
MSSTSKVNSSPENAFIGIDFGTTKTMAARFDTRSGVARTLRLGRGNDQTPTTIYFEESGQKLFGDAADDEGLTDMPNYATRFKMALGKSGAGRVVRGKRVPNTELVTDFLAHVRGHIESHSVHLPVHSVVVTVPAMFGPAQHKDLQDAGREAGFSDVRLLAEPVAAALGYCNLCPEEWNGQRLLVVDWGGGTLDIALVERRADGELRVHDEFVCGLDDVGGEIMDDDLWQMASAGLVSAGYGRLDSQPKEHWGRYRRSLREAKERLSDLQSQDIRFVLSDGSPAKVSLSRADFEEMIAPRLQKAANLVKDVHTRSIEAGHQPDFILLAGGTCRIPAVKKVIEELTGAPCKQFDYGREAIALGASVKAHLEWGEKTSKSDIKNDAQDIKRADAISQYKGLLEGAWIDGVISNDERVFLGKKRKELGLSIEESEIIQRQVLGALIRDIAENETTSSTNYSARKFNCPNRQCGKEMVLTPVEYASKIYACPYCKKSGFISSQQTANVAQTEHYAADGQQVMGQSGSGLEEGYYDVVLADSGRNKIAVIKALREVIPAVGLARARNIVESTPYKIADDASSQSSEEIKRHLEEAGASVRLFRKLSIQSSEMEVASNANVSCHELSVDAMKLPTPVDSSSREVSTRVSSGSLIHRDKVLKLIGRFTSGTPDDSTYVWPKLPPQKIKNAIASYAKVNSSEILLLHDSTVFGSAKDGFIMTSTHIFWKDMNEQPRSIRFSEVSTIIENASTTFIGSGLQINGIPFTPNGGFYNKSLCSMFRKLILAICAINLGN